jgi:hypothetical protein
LGFYKAKERWYIDKSKKREYNRSIVIGKKGAGKYKQNLKYLISKFKAAVLAL